MLSVCDVAVDVGGIVSFPAADEDIGDSERGHPVPMDAQSLGDFRACEQCGHGRALLAGIMEPRHG